MSNWAYPVVPVVVTDPFGYRIHPIYGDRRLHRGTDYRCSYGQTVRASAGGTVIWAGYNGGEGNSVHTRHDDGTITKDFHNSTFATSKGARVSKLEKIAGAGTTGDSTGVHCHFEVHIGYDGNVVDPDAFLRDQGADTYESSSPAGGNATPIPSNSAITSGGETDMIVIQNTDPGKGHVFTVAPEYIHYINNTEHALLLSGVSSNPDEIHMLNSGQVEAVLADYGIPTQYADPNEIIRFGAGDQWSRKLEIQRQLRKIAAKVGAEVLYA